MFVMRPRNRSGILSEVLSSWMCDHDGCQAKLSLTSVVGVRFGSLGTSFLESSSEISANSFESLASSPETQITMPHIGENATICVMRLAPNGSRLLDSAYHRTPKKDCGSQI